MIAYDYVCDRYGAEPLTFRSVAEFTNAVEACGREAPALRLVLAPGGTLEWHDAAGCVLRERALGAPAQEPRAPQASKPPGAGATPVRGSEIWRGHGYPDAAW